MVSNLVAISFFLFLFGPAHVCQGPVFEGIRLAIQQQVPFLDCDAKHKFEYIEFPGVSTEGLPHLVGCGGTWNEVHSPPIGFVNIMLGGILNGRLFSQPSPRALDRRI